MRIIDIYREDTASDTGFRLIEGGFIQAGENTLSRTLNAKTFTMADGSLMMYPAAKDRIQMPIGLECSGNQAALLENAVHYGKLFFAGIHAGTSKSPSQTDKNYPSATKKAFAGYVTGTFRENQISSDLFSIEIPCQFDFDETAAVPVIMTGFGNDSGLKIGDNIQKFSDFAFLKDGFFHRKQIIFTSNAKINLAFPVILSISTEGIRASVSRNNTQVQSWTDLTQDSVCEINLDLQTGINHFQIIIEGVNALYYAHRPMKLQFSVYKFP